MDLKSNILDPRPNAFRPAVQYNQLRSSCELKFLTSDDMADGSSCATGSKWRPSRVKTSGGLSALSSRLPRGRHSALKAEAKKVEIV